MNVSNPLINGWPLIELIAMNEIIKHVHYCIKKYFFLLILDLLCI